MENAVTPPGEQSQLPSMLCGEDGQWVGQPTSSCSCRPGYEAGETDVRCRGEREDLFSSFRFLKCIVWLKSEDVIITAGNSFDLKLDLFLSCGILELLRIVLKDLTL